MNRRKALLQTSLIVGSTILVPSWLTSCKNTSKGGVAYQGDMAEMLGEFSDTLLPTTEDSPGAKAAGNGPVMQTIINDCYTPETAEAVAMLLGDIDQESQNKFNTPFVELDPAQRVEILTPWDTQKDELYVNLKELSVYVYFTSKIGMQEALRYTEVPGKFDGCADYKEGDKAWAWCFFSY
ncbi:hypothetical protein GUA46_11920 [Muricauda sp. HICW]|uniref:Gluconate 2-dehydrogenase subunit 3 family protein n=1 Tax=Flagellimonas chongwuensis TaxID=2697365 RepID=A0A850NJ51_9FLAO|nr:gluconate 2-dehydrogenase subunit 3 family protein [Allomuricauda chongwuensis]NVN19050.1 hypothetical protein [Allomuricauda chongwuensis]